MKKDFKSLHLFTLAKRRLDWLGSIKEETLFMLLLFALLYCISLQIFPGATQVLPSGKDRAGIPGAGDVFPSWTTS